MADLTTSQTITVANAPCSFGAFELTVGINPNVPDPVELLDQVAGTGYAGIDLGPAGYLGLGEELHERLTSRGLGSRRRLPRAALHRSRARSRKRSTET